MLRVIWYSTPKADTGNKGYIPEGPVLGKELIYCPITVGQPEEYTIGSGVDISVQFSVQAAGGATWRVLSGGGGGQRLNSIAETHRAKPFRSSQRSERLMLAVF
jgi:hypothetical protein